MRESTIFKRKKLLFWTFPGLLYSSKSFRDNWQKDCGRAQNIILQFHWKFWLKLNFLRKRVSFCESSFFESERKKSSAMSKLRSRCLDKLFKENNNLKKNLKKNLRKTLSKIFLLTFKIFKKYWREPFDRVQKAFLRLQRRFRLKLVFFRKGLTFCDSSLRKWTKTIVPYVKTALFMFGWTFWGKIFFENLKNCVRTPMKRHFRLPDGIFKEKQIF